MIKHGSKVLTSAPVIYVSLPRKKFSGPQNNTIDAAEEKAMRAPADDSQPSGMHVESPNSSNRTSRKPSVRISLGNELLRNSPTPPLQLIDCRPESESYQSALKSSFRKKSALKKVRENVEGLIKRSEEETPQMTTKQQEWDRGCLPEDLELRRIIKSMLVQLKDSRSLKEEILVISRLVTTQMGGPKTVDIKANVWRSHLYVLARRFRNCCIPIGSITMGNHYHRAFLLKVLADRLHIPVSLVRGKSDTENG